MGLLQCLCPVCLANTGMFSGARIRMKNSNFRSLGAAIIRVQLILITFSSRVIAYITLLKGKEKQR